MLSIQKLKTSNKDDPDGERAEERVMVDCSGFRARGTRSGVAGGIFGRVLFPLILRQFQCNDSSVRCTTLLSWPSTVCNSKVIFWQVRQDLIERAELIKF